MIGDIISGVGSAIGGWLGGKANEEMNKKQIKYAKELNKNKIQWAVADAKKAGIHPLAALGSAAAGGFATPNLVANTGAGDAIAAGAQALGRGISNKMAMMQGMERAGLENDLLRAQTAKEKAAAVDLLTQATSCSRVAVLRRAGTGGPGSGLDTTFGERGSPKEVTIVGPGGSMKTSKTTDAQTMEDQYGDVVGGVYGIGRWFHDAGKHVWTKRPQWMRW